MVALIGAAGVGKSRLVAELKERAPLTERTQFAPLEPQARCISPLAAR